MPDIFIKQIQEVGEYWIVYQKADGETGHIQLSACANNYSIHRGGGSEDGPKCVGLRYEKDGCGWYELFNVGHLRIQCPLKPTGLQKLLGGKNAGQKLRQQYEAIEKQLNEYGWKTNPESYPESN